MIPMWCSILCGALIGFEREYKKKDAGLKTSIFICVGACIWSFMSVNIAGSDQSRVLAQIVSGIGFIGGGVIIKINFKLRGLTSAAIIWMSAAAGALCGLTLYKEAIMSSLTIVILDAVLSKIKKWMSNTEDEE